MFELFVDLKGMENKYKIGWFGNIWSKKRKKILKPADNGYGYLMACLQSNRGQKMFRINRLVAINFIPNPENKPEVNHKFPPKTNNCHLNLEWATRSENQKHAYENSPDYLNKISGENNSSSKLTKKYVLEIMTIKRDFPLLPNAIIGEMYDVHKSTIQAVLSGRNWNERINT